MYSTSCQKKKKKKRKSNSPFAVFPSSLSSVRHFFLFSIRMQGSPCITPHKYPARQSSIQREGQGRIWFMCQRLALLAGEPTRGCSVGVQMRSRCSPTFDSSFKKTKTKTLSAVVYSSALQGRMENKHVAHAYVTMCPWGRGTSGGGQTAAFRIPSQQQATPKHFSIDVKRLPIG